METLIARLKGWCGASGSEDEFRIVDGMDTVQCARCERWLYPTRRGTLPRHKEPKLSDPSATMSL